MEKKSRVAWIDILKALGMFFVVIGHATNDSDPGSYRYYIYAFHMPLFFIISGMSFYLQISRKLYTFKEMFVNKLNSLIVPYFILSFLPLPLWVLTYQVLSDSENTIITKILGVFYSNASVFSAFSNALWFIPALFLTTIAFFGLLKWTKEDEKSLILVILVITALGYANSIQDNRIPLPWHLDTVLISLVFFLIGYLFIKYLDYIKTFVKSNRNVIITIIIILPLAFLFARFNVKISMHSNLYGSIFHFMIASLGFSLILILISMKVPNFKILNFIGRNTLVYLAFHAPIFRLLSKASQTSSVLLENHPIIIGSLVFVALIPIAYIFEKYFPFLIGRSKNKLFKI